MPLPLLDKEIEMVFQEGHLASTFPREVEVWLEQNGYVYRLLGNYATIGTSMAAEHCHPLMESHLPDDDAELRQRLEERLAMAHFIRQDNGTYLRGDVLIYIQPKAARDAWREHRKIEQLQMEGEEAVIEKANEINERAKEDGIPISVVPGQTADGGNVGIPSPSDHASGGVKELERSLEGTGLMDRVSSKLKGSKKE